MRNKNSQEKIKDNKKVGFKEFFDNSFWAIKTYFKLFPVPAIIFIFEGIYSNISGLFYSFIAYKIVDKIILIKNGSVFFSSLYPYFFAIALYFFINSLFQFLKNYAGWKIDVYKTNLFEEMIFDHLNKMSVFQIENPEINNKMNTVRQFLQNISGFSYMIISLISELIAFIASLILIISLIPQIVPFIFIFGIFRFILEKKYVKKSFSFFIDNNENRRIAYMGSNNLIKPSLLAEVKVSNAFENLKNNFVNYFEDFNKKYFSILKKRISIIFLLDFIRSSGYVFFYIFIIIKFIASKITTIGNLTFQFGILKSFFSSFDNILNNLIRIGDQVVRNREVYTFFHIKPENMEYKNIKMKKLELPLDININNISFKYPNSDKYIYENFSLNIKAGEKIAIVGENGAGKTTLSKLLAGMYEVNSGNIAIGKDDIRYIIPETLYRNFGILFQEYNFYDHLSVKENVTISSDKKKHKEEEIINCLKSSQAWEFVSAYKNKLDQKLSETITGGIKPSTGQKQKIAIARFFYQNAPFVIFDEPTSSIDAVSEFNIFNNIYKFFKNKTVIIISHRFSTIKNADRIIVIDKGAIVEQGNHEYLMKLNGMYAKSFKMQADGYNN